MSRRIILLLFLILALATSSERSFAQIPWSFIGVSENGDTTFVTKPEKIGHGIRTLWTRVVNVSNPTDQSSYSTTVTRTVNRIEINCSKKRIRIVSHTSYFRDGHNETDEQATDWSLVIPGSIGESIFGYACEGKHITQGEINPDNKLSDGIVKAAEWASPDASWILMTTRYMKLVLNPKSLLFKIDTVNFLPFFPYAFNQVWIKFANNNVDTFRSRCVRVSVPQRPKNFLDQWAESQTFGSFDTLRATVHTEGASLGDTLTIGWYALKDNQKFARCAAPLSKGSNQTDFSLITDGPWPEGRYRVKAHLRGIPTDSTEFNIIKLSP